MLGSSRSLATPFSAFFVLAMLECGATKSVCDDPGNLDSGPGDDTNTTFEIGGDGPSSDGLVTTGIEIDPSNAVVYIDTATTPATPATQAFKITLHNDDGTSTDVTASAAMTIDDTTLGSFAGTTFTSTAALPGTTLGVTSVIHASAAGKNGAGNITIVELRRIGDKKDFFFIEPYMGAPSPTRDVLKFGTNIKQVDIAFCTDTTGSMSGSITNLNTGLPTLFDSIKKAIPSVGLSVVDHKDYGDTWVVKVGQIVTTDITKAKAAAAAMSAGGGGDGPEAQISAMTHILTGEAVAVTPVHKPAPGTFGGVDFRPGSLPVVVEITDVDWHDPSGSWTMATLKANFIKANAKFVDITNGAWSAPEAQADELSDATKSNIPPSAFAGKCGSGQCCTGMSGAARAPTGPGGKCRLNFLHNSGAGVSDSIVAAIQAISVGSVFDVTAKPSNDPANADGVDATLFIKALRAMAEGDAVNGCPAATAKDTDGDTIDDTFVSVKVGTPVCFEVLPQMNTTVKPKSSAQFFNAFIDVLGMPGSVKLDRRTVLFLVPPKEIAAK
jgi:hypothetical protein